METPTHRCASIGWPARNYLHQLCAHTGCGLENLPGAMDDRDGWWERERERVREVHASSITRWWVIANWHKNHICFVLITLSSTPNPASTLPSSLSSSISSLLCSLVSSFMISYSILFKCIPIIYLFHSHICYSLLYSQYFSRYILQPSSGLSCQTLEFTKNLKLNPLFEPQERVVPILSTMTGYKC